MTNTALKILALIAMTLDHIAVHFNLSHELSFLLRSIGRTAMPLFCFLIAEGFRHTSNRRDYFFRLFGFALLLESCLAVYYLISGQNYLFRFNIFLTLTAGLACLLLLKSTDIYLKLLGLFLIASISFTHIDYGMYGILMILLFALTEDFFLYAIGLFALNLVFIHVLPYLQLERMSFSINQWFSMVSLLGILFYNGLLGKGNKAFFYCYYPLHLIIIIAIKQFLIEISSILHTLLGIHV